MIIHVVTGVADEAENASALTLMVLFSTPLAVPQSGCSEREGETCFVSANDSAVARCDKAVSSLTVVVTEIKIKLAVGVSRGNPIVEGDKWHIVCSRSLYSLHSHSNIHIGWETVEFHRE
jgi:hypothetical protein